MHRHAETRKVSYSPKQMFDLVADVGRYPEFLPWCLAARVTAREPGMLRADLVVGKGPFRETFTSLVTLDEGKPEDGGREAPPFIEVEYIKGPMREMSNRWVFRPASDGGTEIGFMVEFEFRSRMLDRIMSHFFEETVTRMVDAFLARADALYGAA